MREGHTQHPDKANVWAGIIGDRVIGPIFFAGNFHGAGYLEFLQEELIPNLAILFPDHVEAAVPNRNIWFQKDGARLILQDVPVIIWVEYFQADGLVEEDEWRRMAIQDPGLDTN